MGQRLKKSSLFFGQVAGGQQPKQYEDTLSGFYGGVGAGQTEAVKTLGQKVQEKTQGLAGALGMEQKVDEQDPTKVTTGLTAGSQFRPTVDTSKAIPSITPGGAATPVPTTQVEVPKQGPNETNEDYLKKLNDALKAAGTSIEEWKASGKSAEDYLRKVLADKQKAAGEAATEAQAQVTEKKLGARAVAPSELEKQASMYQNVLATSPGTTNVEALASLSRFFDPKYATLESGLRQGETALARQEAIGNVAAKQQAEQARAAAVGEYSKQAKELGQTLQERVGEAGEAESKRLVDYYGGKQTEAEKAQTELKTKIGTTEQAIEKDAQTKMGEEYKRASENRGLDSISNVLKAIKGRSSDNWLNTRGSEVLEPLKSRMQSLKDQADQIKDSVSYTTQEKTQKLQAINNDIKNVNTQVARELAAFLGDTNTHPGDALDAAEQIMSAGLINYLSPEETAMIRQRIEKDRHVDNRKNTRSTPEKLNKVYMAFGGSPYALESLGYNFAKDERKWYEL